MKDKLLSTIAKIARQGRLRLLLFILLFVGLSAAAPYLIYKEMGAQPLAFDADLLSWPVLAGVVVLLIVYFGADGLRLLYTLRALGHSVPKRSLWQLVFINIFISNVTPMATGGGVGQVWYLQRLGVPVGTAMAATTVRTMLAMLFIFFPAPLLVLFMEPLQKLWGGDKMGVYLALIAGAYLGFFVVVLWKMRWIMLVISQCLALLVRFHLLSPARRLQLRRSIWKELVRFRVGVKAYFHGSKSAVFLSVLFTFIFLLALFSLPALLLWGLGYDVGYLTSVALLLVTTFFMYFAPTPGASGVAEGLFGYSFRNLVGPEDLLLAIIAWRFLTIHIGMLIGAAVTLRQVAKRGRRG